MSDATTYVIDAESGAEMSRLIEQERILTRVMGGSFPDDFQPAPGKAVLDLACGPGGWVQEVAFDYPFLEVVGVDISQKMIMYAQSLAETQHLKNLRFEVIDVRTMLPKFSNDSFDFINARLLTGFMMKEDWSGLISQCMRILRPGGVVCLTECDGLSKTTSAAFTTMQDIIANHSYEVGRTFQAADWGITPRLSRFLRNAGCKSVQVKGHVIDWSAGTSAWPVVREDFTLACKLMQSYLVKAGATTDERWDGLWEQAREEFYEADFSALWYLVSAWGQKTV